MKFFAKILSVGALLAATAPFASATSISIAIQQAGVNGGAITQVATDGGTGYATFGGAYGTFTFNAVTATGAPIRAQGNLSTTSLHVSGTQATAGVINIFITETGLTSPTGAATLFSGFTANQITGGGTVTETTFFSNTNALYGGTQIGSAVFNGMGTSSASTLVNLAGTYSETIEYSFAYNAGGNSADDTVVLTASTTPEPSSLAFLGTGLLGVVGIARRRFKA